MVVLQSDRLYEDEILSLEIPAIHGMDTLDQVIEGLMESKTADLLEKAYSIIEKPLLSKLMLRVGDNQSEAARKLGVSRNTLRKLLAKHGMLS